MALTLQQHQSLAGDNQKQMPTSILLNSDRQYSFTLAPPSQRRPSSRASSTMSSQSDVSSNPADSTTYSTPLHPTGRRILVKFAPLPDPRKLEEENDPLSPASDTEEAAHEDVRRSNTDGLLTGVSGLSASSAKYPDNGFGSGVAADSKQQRSPRWSTMRLLRPLLPRSSQGDGPIQSDIPSDSLFRPSSIDSVRSTQSASAASGTFGSGTFSAFSTRLLPQKSRSVSDLESHRERAAPSSPYASVSGYGSVSRATSALFGKMTPLTQTISENSVNASPSAPSSDTGIRRTRSHTSNGVASNASKRRFMLNGRMYGSRRGAETPDPFSRQRAYEQEFVEWGSGGVGSVPSNRATGAVADWDRVRSGGPAEDQDDGSGMGWVKKRREARERAKREADARATKQSEAEPATSSFDSAPRMSSEPGNPPAPTTDEPVALAEDVRHANSSQHPEPGEPVSQLTTPHVPRTYSTATIRNTNSNDGSAAASAMPIPQIIVDSSRSSNNATAISLHPMTSSADLQYSQFNDTTAPRPHPHAQPEHMTEMAVVVPHPHPHHRRSDSRRHDPHDRHHQPTPPLVSQQQLHQAVAHEKHPDAIPLTNGHVGDDEREKDDAATLRGSLRKMVNIETSSASSERSTEEEEEDSSEIDMGRNDEDDEDDDEVSLHASFKLLGDTLCSLLNLVCVSVVRYDWTNLSLQRRSYD